MGSWQVLAWWGPSGGWGLALLVDPVRFFLSLKFLILSLFLLVRSSRIMTAPLQFVLVHSLRLTTPMISRSLEAVGAETGGGECPFQVLISAALWGLGTDHTYPRVPCQAYCASANVGCPAWGSQ